MRAIRRNSSEQLRRRTNIYAGEGNLYEKNAENPFVK